MSSAEIAPPRSQPANRGSRRRSRELALQALYQWLLSGDEADTLCVQAAENKDYSRADTIYFQVLARGVIERSGELHAALRPFLDRPAQQLSPIEHALLLVGARRCWSDSPWASGAAVASPCRVWRFWPILCIFHGSRRDCASPACRPTLQAFSTSFNPSPIRNSPGPKLIGLV